MKLLKKTDFIIIVLILVIAAAMWFVYKSRFSNVAAKAEIYYYSTLVETIDMRDKSERTFSIAQNENVVFLLDNDGNIQFIKSDCPDKVCVNTGKIHMVGQSAACLPNGIVVKIVPGGERSEDDPDIVVGR
ncbi:MAG: NusG domain II-containing protein [Clostridiaceae bacterium]|nr:NusG domain II-containing protein [Clostridiaceae bacterium]